MKKVFTSLLLLAGCVAFAQTTINTTTISGTWTLAGSPYIVQVPTQVLAGDVLTIEPGVTVRFQAETKMTIDGQLIAAGTSGLPITFTADDTTSWANLSTTAGGWSGIHYMQYTGGGTDHSVIDHCVITHGKYGFSSSQQYVGAFSTERALKIINTTFRRNHSGAGTWYGDSPIKIYTWHEVDTVEINNCVVTDNYCPYGIIYTTNYLGGATRIVKSNIHHNHLGSGILGFFNHMLIEENQIHHNVMDGDNASIKLSVGATTIRNNKVYNNECEQLATIGCRSGQVTIENNLICNNRQNDGSCGAAGGGGGIHLAHNEGAADFIDTYYIVRNNVIANNLSAYGGGGIYVYNAKATISNNHIVNNHTPGYMGQGILVLSPASEVDIKNNLFYSESSLGVVDTFRIIYILSANTIHLDYNYLPATYSHCVDGAFGYTLIGDTIHNVIGTHPAMIAPTTDYELTTSALLANFALLSSSPCINHGDTVGTFPSTVDYLNHNRIVGASIDIGAFEYGSSQDLMIEENKALLLSIYPNPALANGSFTVYTAEQEGRLIIQDLSGRIVWQQEVHTNSNTISLQQASRGIYLVSFLGKTHATGKLVVN
jgi:hypothetical protein